jgi:threonylcarbamoyladenosine tRNA methylthiotransferase MtaB
MKELTYSVATFGCKVNQTESYEIEKSLAKRGWSQSGRNPSAYIINTCAVTKVSEGKSRRLIKRIIRENPLSKLIVTGCYASSNPKEIKSIIRKGIDTIVPQSSKKSIPDILISVNGSSETAQIPEKHRTRAFLKIQDGCANFCSYCIVPFLRGKPVSKSVAESLKESNDLVNQGFREIVLTGINLGKNKMLTDLLKEMVLINGLERIRISSIELNDVTNDLILFVKKNPKICPHFHIPLQSGSDKILKAMNRKYTANDYLKKISQIRKLIPGAGITTDIIIGFPGETESDFQETLNVAERAKFSKIHIFPYSPRPGTKAEKLSARIMALDIKNRYNKLNSLAREMALGFKEKFIGKYVKVLLEGDGESGFSPEYLRVKLAKAEADKINNIVNVLIDKANPEYLEGKIAL